MNRIDDLASALKHAILIGLDPLLYPETKWTDEVSATREKIRVVRETGRMKEVRPHEGMCSVWMFDQTWSSTALGFGGIGGQAMTTASTVVIEGPMGDACVYFSGRPAYHVKRPNWKFREDVTSWLMKDVTEAAEYERSDDVVN